MSKQSSASKIKLESYGGLFGKTELPVVKQVIDTEQVVEIPLADLYTFHNHPFKVLDDEKMDELVQSIKQNGVLVPAIVRKSVNGGYELISGHRRKHACEIAGLEKMPVFVKDMSDDESVVTMVDANIQRENILPSEKARAYKLKYEAMYHRGVKSEAHTVDVIGNAAGESGKTVQRFIWLARLSDELLDMVDEKKIGLSQGIDLSFLSEEQQNWVWEFIEETQVNISREQSAKLKEYGKKNELTRAMVEVILSTERPKKERRVILKVKDIEEYFEEETSEEEMIAAILDLLKDRKNRH